MGSAARFVAQFFPLFLLGAVFAKLMEDSGSVSAIAKFMMQRLGERHAILAWRASRQCSLVLEAAVAESALAISGGDPMALRIASQGFSRFEVAISPATIVGGAPTSLQVTATVWDPAVADHQGAWDYSPSLGRNTRGIRA
jgi:hypothetical protein